MNTIDIFNRQVERTIWHETMGRRRDYVNDPQDPGGETKFGISKRTYPNLNIKELSYEMACGLYFADFWRKPLLDTLSGIDVALACKTFDLGVNCGPRTAIRFLQRAVNTVCAGAVPAHRAATWRQSVARFLKGGTLLVDGILGPVSFGVISHCPYPVAEMAALKGEAYRHYAGGDPLYIPGWLERLES